MDSLDDALLREVLLYVNLDAGLRSVSRSWHALGRSSARRLRFRRHPALWSPPEVLRARSESSVEHREAPDADAFLRWIAARRRQLVHLDLRGLSWVVDDHFLDRLRLQEGAQPPPQSSSLS